jgi:hypothetical protein
LQHKGTRPFSSLLQQAFEINTNSSSGGGGTGEPVGFRNINAAPMLQHFPAGSPLWVPVR